MIGVQGLERSELLVSSKDASIYLHVHEEQTFRYFEPSKSAKNSRPLQDFCCLKASVLNIFVLPFPKILQTLFVLRPSCYFFQFKVNFSDCLTY